MATTTVLDLGALLEQADLATAALRTARSVPEEVASFVDGLADLLHAEAPESLGTDPYLASSLYAGALRAMRALHQGGGHQRGELRLALEQVRQAARDAVAGAPVSDGRPVKTVLRELSAMVRVPQPELAALLGVSTRQLQRWLADDGPVPSGREEGRVRALAKLAAQLRHVLTGPGVAAWFTRQHPELGVAPVELLADPLELPRLVELASALRAQGG
jgi:hypothetical protein